MGLLITCNPPYCIKMTSSQSPATGSQQVRVGIPYVTTGYSMSSV